MYDIIQNINNPNPQIEIKTETNKNQGSHQNYREKNEKSSEKFLSKIICNISLILF